LALVIWSYSSQVYAAGSVVDDVSANTLELDKCFAQANMPLIAAGTLINWFSAWLVIF
jgi:hypothetical protein